MTSPIYLDNGATTYPKPESVYHAVTDYMRHIGVTSGRGAYQRALDADALVYDARKLLIQLLGVNRPSQLVFLPGVTYALNLVIRGYIRPGDHVVTTGVEHNAAWRPLCAARDRGANVEVIPGTAEGSVQAADMITAITARTRLVVMVHASNVTGAMLPVCEVAEHCRRLGVAMVIDMAQSAGCVPIEGVDGCLLAFTGHKGLLGLPGTGGLYVPDGLDIEPLIEGGTGEDSRSDRQPSVMPERYEAGTMNVPGISGLKAGVEYVLERSVADIHSCESDLIDRAREGLGRIRGLTLYGPEDRRLRVGVLSFTVAGMGVGQIAAQLDRDYGVEVRAGLHCATLCHRTIGTGEQGTVRVSVGPFSTVDDIDRLVDAVRDMVGRDAGE